MLCDAYGRPLCPLCLHPMSRDKARDHETRIGARGLVFACAPCDAVHVTELKWPHQPVAARFFQANRA